MKARFGVLIIFSVVLFSFKEKPVTVNKDFLGNYIATDSAVIKRWTLKINPTADNKIDFYTSAGTDPKFTVVMKDSTHFKTTRDYIEVIPNVGNKYWSAKGTFLNDGKMEITIHNSDVSAGLKVSFSMDADPKIIYTKQP